MNQSVRLNSVSGGIYFYFQSSYLILGIKPCIYKCIVLFYLSCFHNSNPIRKGIAVLAGADFNEWRDVCKLF